MSYAQRADDIIFQAGKNVGATKPNTHSDASSKCGPQPMDIDPMQLDSTLKGPLTPHLKKRLISEDRCFYCRWQGHMVDDCPRKGKAEGQY